MMISDQYWEPICDFHKSFILIYSSDILFSTLSWLWIIIFPQCLRKLNIISPKVCGTILYPLDGKLNKLICSNLPSRGLASGNGKKLWTQNVLKVNPSLRSTCKPKDYLVSNPLGISWDYISILWKSSRTTWKRQEWHERTTSSLTPKTTLPKKRGRDR